MSFLTAFISFDGMCLEREGVDACNKLKLSPNQMIYGVYDCILVNTCMLDQQHNEDESS